MFVAAVFASHGLKPRVLPEAVTYRFLFQVIRPLPVPIMTTAIALGIRHIKISMLKSIGFGVIRPEKDMSPLVGNPEGE